MKTLMQYIARISASLRKNFQCYRIVGNTENMGDTNFEGYHLRLFGKNFWIVGTDETSL